jgi:hypothetical protein
MEGLPGRFDIAIGEVVGLAKEADPIRAFLALLAEKCGVDVESLAGQGREEALSRVRTVTQRVKACDRCERLYPDNWHIGAACDHCDGGIVHGFEIEQPAFPVPGLHGTKRKVILWEDDSAGGGAG